VNYNNHDIQQRRIALLLRSGSGEDGEQDLSLNKSLHRGAQPSCPLFSSQVADYFNQCFPNNFELFMLFYQSQFPFSKVRRGLSENFGLLGELMLAGDIQ
jgi:hypothetical protein